MANLQILSDVPSDLGAFSGGSWFANLPLTNLLTQQPKQVARSTSAATSATRFVCDLGQARQLQSFALIGSNLSAKSKVRFRVSNNADSSAPLIDATVSGYPPNIVFGSMPWGQFPWSGYRDDPLPAGQVTYYQAPAPVAGRYVFIDVDDATNTAGYVQIGRFMAGAAFVPRYNMAYGAALKWNDPTRVSTSVGGQKWFDKRPNFRGFRASFEHATEGEAYGAIYDLHRRVGISGNLLMIYDPADQADVILRRTIYGSMTELSEIVTANASVDAPYTWSLAIEELI
ncbi:hypothetical protein [Methylorubrum sp. SB2]|uniref:hypothetical protein n=1 Tax=Methylorubrum subtropicum TaxID=3138812 RepID=UPI00313E375B